MLFLALSPSPVWSESEDEKGVSPPAEKGAKPEKPAEAEYVGMETCAACHEGIVQQYRLESHYGTNLSEGEKIKGGDWEACHGPGSLHVENDGDKAKNVRYSPERCFSCHLDKRAQFQLQYHHPVPEGQMKCTDCHDFHRFGEAVHTVTDLERSDEKCFKCHKEMKGPFVFEHDAMREGCQTCHEPHGGVYNKLLVADDNALCLRCHWEPNTNNAAGNIGGVPHGTGAASNYFIGSGEDCVDHHRSTHGSNIWRTFNR